MISKIFINKFLSHIDKIDQIQLTNLVKRIVTDLDSLYYMMDQSPQGILIFNEREEVEYANQKAVEILRFDSREEILSKTLPEVVYNMELRKYLKYKISREESIIDEEHIMGMPLVRVMRINFFPVRDKTNEIQFHVFSFMDITRRKLEEIKNRRSESIASMGHLAAGLAHEIKNPLASIDIHLKLMNRLLNNAPDFEDKNELNGFLSVVQEEVNRLNSIVQDFLSSIRPISLDLKRVKERNIEVIFYPEDNLPAVLADEKYLRIVFLNLIKNAMEAFPEGQDRCEVLIKISENYPFIETVIQDNGKGIPPAELDKIFDPYYTTKSFGTGIGLTLVHKIITEHLGNIKVESQENSGTAFTVMLPQYKGEATKYLEAKP
jgi:PAS domain S-box-containing protein